MAPRHDVDGYAVGRSDPPAFVVIVVVVVERMDVGVRAELVFDGGTGGFGDVDEGDVDGWLMYVLVWAAMGEVLGVATGAVRWAMLVRTSSTSSWDTIGMSSTGDIFDTLVRVAT